MQVIVLKWTGGSPRKLTGFGDSAPCKSVELGIPQICAFTASGTLGYLLQLNKEVWLEGPVLGRGVRKVAYIR